MCKLLNPNNISNKALINYKAYNFKGLYQDMNLKI